MNNLQYIFPASVHPKGKSVAMYGQSRFSLYAEYASCVGPPCSQRCFNFSFVFEFGKRLWKHEWSFLLMRCAVTLSTWKSAKSCNVNVLQSLALTKKNELKAYRAAEERLFLERFPWVWIEMTWNTDKCVSSILSSQNPHQSFACQSQFLHIDIMPNRKKKRAIRTYVHHEIGLA